jgi:hypothetical protein
VHDRVFEHSDGRDAKRAAERVIERRRQDKGTVEQKKDSVDDDTMSGQLSARTNIRGLRNDVEVSSRRTILTKDLGQRHHRF